MAKDNEQMTMEEYLLSQLDTPVMTVAKDNMGNPVLDENGKKQFKPVAAEDGHIMTKQEAIATNLMNLAMKGDVKAIQYIQNIQMRAKIMKGKK